MRIVSCLAMVVFACASVAHADPVEEALEAARSAYAAGDLSGTAAQITAASRAVFELQGERLQAMLPEAPAGWSREIEQRDEGASMMMTSLVGNSVAARYRRGDEEFTLTLTADSPLVAQMAGMLGNLQMMSMVGKVRKIAGQDMLEQDQTLSGLAAGRVLVQAQGMDSEAMQEVLEQIDFARLANYDG